MMAVMLLRVVYTHQLPVFKAVAQVLDTNGCDWPILACNTQRHVHKNQSSRLNESGWRDEGSG